MSITTRAFWTAIHVMVSHHGVSEAAGWVVIGARKLLFIHVVSIVLVILASFFQNA